MLLEEHSVKIITALLLHLVGPPTLRREVYLELVTARPTQELVEVASLIPPVDNLTLHLVLVPLLD